MLTLINILCENLPVVFMHGLTQNAYENVDMLAYIQSEIPDAYIINCEVGNGALDTIFMGLNDQVEELSTCINNDKMTHNGFIAFGYSQGGYLLRTYIQKYNHIRAPAKRFVSLSSPLAGFFCGFSFECYGFGIWSDIIQFLEPNIAYSNFVQSMIGPSNYWRDPFHEEAYLEGARHLPYLDNLKNYDEQQKTNFVSVDMYVLFGSPKDGAITPWQSAFFGQQIGNDTNIVEYWNRPDFNDDNFGLRTMHEQNKIKTFETEFSHFEYHEPKAEQFLRTQVAPWLKMQK